MKYDTIYEGTGNDKQVGFVRTCMQMATGLNNLTFYMGQVGGGMPVDIEISKDKIIVDMSKLIFPAYVPNEGGTASGEAHFFKPVSDTGANITIGYGELSQIGVGLSIFTEATHTVTGGTSGTKNYLIVRYKYSDGVISLDERTTAPDPTDNVYMELEICRVWLDGGAAFFDSYYGIGRYSFGGVLLS